jgi:hypothetical protein
MKFCKSCGTQMDDDARFCTKCGGATDGAPAEVKAAPPARRLALAGIDGKSVLVDQGIITISKKKGMFNAARDKSIPIKNVTSVEVKKPGAFIVGFIQFSIAGGIARNSSYTITGGAFDAVQDENSVAFRDKRGYEDALAIKGYIEQYFS